ncbi:hypothetical protein Hjap01_03153 [Haloarcula japonica]
MNVRVSVFTGDRFCEMYHRLAGNFGTALDTQAVFAERPMLHIPTGVSRQVVGSA